MTVPGGENPWVPFMVTANRGGVALLQATLIGGQSVQNNIDVVGLKAIDLPGTVTIGNPVEGTVRLSEYAPRDVDAYVTLSAEKPNVVTIEPPIVTIKAHLEISTTFTLTAQVAYDNLQIFAQLGRDRLSTVVTIPPAPG